MPLIHCIYASTATGLCTDADLREFVGQAQESNFRAGITGMLVYSDGNFFQIIEGEAVVVDALFARITRDRRHTRVTRIIREPIARRAFARWPLAYVQLSTPALNRLLHDGRGPDAREDGRSWLSAVDEGRAKKLLAAFARGRWRSRMASVKPSASRSHAA